MIKLKGENYSKYQVNIRHTCYLQGVYVIGDRRRSYVREAFPQDEQNHGKPIKLDPLCQKKITTFRVFRQSPCGLLAINEDGHLIVFDIDMHIRNSGPLPIIFQPGNGKVVQIECYHYNKVVLTDKGEVFYFLLVPILTQGK